MTIHWIRWGRIWLLCLAALCCLATVALCLGEPTLTLTDLHALLWQDGGERIARLVFWELRLPRLCLALLSGAMLGLTGVLLQDSFRNALAGPELLGVAAGASLVAAVILIFNLPILAWWLPWLAFGGGLMGGVLILVAARQVHDPLRLILIGAALTALLNALLIAVISLGTQNEITLLFLFLLGSLANRTWAHVQIVWPWAAVGIPLALLCARPLNLLQLGDEMAAGLGLPVAVVRPLLLTIGVALVAAVVAVCGPIGWVALLAPHLARRLLGTTDARRVLPLAMILGATLLLAADQLARLLFAPTELPVGLWTTIIGGPVLLWMLYKQV